MFNIQQLEIINYDFLNKNSPNAVCVVAGAGSGKTTTIIEKIVKMVKSGLQPSYFFITTFTRKAATQLKDKLSKYLSLEQIKQMTIGTFHSIAFYYINKYNQLNQPTKSQSNQSTKAESNQSNKAQSFDQLLYEYIKLTKTQLYQQNEIHNYIFIDEFQDIDIVQSQIINNIYMSNQLEPCQKLLMVIGDDQQNIYTFRGSDINFMLNFEKAYSGKILKLETNYRSFPAIVRVSNHLLSYAKNKIDKTFIPSPNLSKTKTKNKIRLKVIKTSYDRKNQIEKFIAEKIELINKQYDISTYAIISRTKRQLVILENLLARKKIPTIYLETLESNINYQSEQNQSKRLILTTIHGTKGLEYHNVVFLDFDHTNLHNADIEEERRLYYVALTRAKSNLLILMNNEPKYFLNEIFNASFQNNTLFDNFDVSWIKKIPEYSINEESDNMDYSVISVTHLLKNINWIQQIQLNEKINYIDISFCKNKISDQLRFLSKSLYKNELITNYQNLIGIIVENYINYIMASSIESDIFSDLLDNILTQSKNYLNVLKNKSYDKLLKKYYNLDIDTDLITYCEQNNSYLKYISLVKKRYYMIEFKKDKGSSYDESFIKKCLSSYTNLIKKQYDESNKNLLNDIIIYSINELILDSGRFSLQYLNINNFLSYFSDLDKTEQFIEVLNQNLITKFEYDNILIQKKLLYSDEITGKKIIGVSDVIAENDDEFMVIDIKATTNSCPDIKYLLQIIIYSCIYLLETNKRCNRVGIYSALYGNIFIWELNINSDNAINFLNEICHIDDVL
jgi:hypothetical protein